MADHIVNVSSLTELVNFCHSKLKQVINYEEKQRLLLNYLFSCRYKRSILIW